MNEKIIALISRFVFRYYQRRCQTNLIYFESFHGKKYADNPRAIYEYIKQNYPDYHCVWGVKKGYEQVFIDAEVPYIYRFSKEWYQIVSQARFWITNTRTVSWILKAQHTKYLQTWHGTPLKHIGLDIEDAQIGNMNTQEYRQSVCNDTSLWDVILSQSSYTSNCFKSAFNLDDSQILEIGSPRNDVLLSDDEQFKKKIKSDLNLFGKKIILYAPTWRENQKDQNVYQYQLPFDLENVINSQDEDSVLLLRMHYLVSDKINIPKNLQNKVYNVSTYPNMADLLRISDLLITDYSSSFFDYSLLERPMLFYLPDRKSYEQELRGLYIDDLESFLPGPIVENSDDLAKYMQILINNNIYLDKIKNFKETYNQYQTSDTIIKIVQWMKECEVEK